MADSLKCHTSCKTHVSCHHLANSEENKYVFSNQSKLNIRLKVVVGALKSSPWRIVKCVNSKKNKAKLTPTTQMSGMVFGAKERRGRMGFFVVGERGDCSRGDWFVLTHTYSHTHIYIHTINQTFNMQDHTTGNKHVLKNNVPRSSPRASLLFFDRKSTYSSTSKYFSAEWNTCSKEHHVGVVFRHKVVYNISYFIYMHLCPFSTFRRISNTGIKGCRHF